MYINESINYVCRATKTVTIVSCTGHDVFEIVKYIEFQTIPDVDIYESIKTKT